MAQKTQINNPTANPFELLGVDEEPEKRPTKGPQKKTGGAAPAGGNQQQERVVVGQQTPAERAQRRKAQAKVKTAAEKEAETQKRKEDGEKALAAMMGPLDGFQVQKGGQKPKPVEGQEKKQKTFTRDQFEKLEEKPNQEPRKFQNKTGKTPLAPREHREPRDPRDPRNDGPNKKEGHTGSETRTQKFTPTERPNRPARHEGYDKHSGSKFGGKSKKDAADWGNPVQEWNSNQATESTPLSGAGWAADGEQPTESAAPNAGWGGDAAQPAADATEAQAPPKDVRPQKPAWDDEGFGKMTLEEFQKSVAAQREKALKNLTGTKQARTTVETQADPAKFLVKDKQLGDAKVVQKQPKQEAPKKPAQQKKQAPAKPQAQAVSVSDVFNVRQKGGVGPRGPRPGGDRATPTGTPPGEQQQGNWQGNSDRPPRQNTNPNSPKGQRVQGGGGGGYKHRVPNANQFPDLPVKQVQQTQPAQGSNAPAAQSAQNQTAAPTAAK